MFSKNGPTFVRNFDIDVRECTGARLETRGPIEWIDVLYRGAPRRVWIGPAGGITPEDIRMLDQFFRASPAAADIAEPQPAPRSEHTAATDSN